MNALSRFPVTPPKRVEAAGADALRQLALNGTGEAWSVEPEIFATSYEHIQGDRWRRTGEVSAQPAMPGELVISLEGPATAAAGDWVIKGAAGEQWITSAEHFAANYQREPSG